MRDGAVLGSCFFFFYVEKESGYRGRKCRLKILKCRQQQHEHGTTGLRLWPTRDRGGGRHVDVKQLRKNQKWALGVVGEDK